MMLTFAIIATGYFNGREDGSYMPKHVVLKRATPPAGNVLCREEYNKYYL
jgi:hypothetical protein